MMAGVNYGVPVWPATGMVHFSAEPLREATATETPRSISLRTATAMPVAGKVLRMVALPNPLIRNTPQKSIQWDPWTSKSEFHCSLLAAVPGIQAKARMEHAEPVPGVMELWANKHSCHALNLITAVSKN